MVRSTTIEDFVGQMAQVGPGEAQHAVAVGDGLVVAPSIAIEVVDPGVPAPAVGLDDQRVGRQQDVDPPGPREFATAAPLGGRSSGGSADGRTCCTASLRVRSRVASSRLPDARGRVAECVGSPGRADCRRRTPAAPRTRRWTPSSRGSHRPLTARVATGRRAARGRRASGRLSSRRCRRHWSAWRRHSDGRSPMGACSRS